jgi:hypothetical protein
LLSSLDHLNPFLDQFPQRIGFPIGQEPKFSRLQPSQRQRAHPHPGQTNDRMALAVCTGKVEVITMEKLRRDLNHLLEGNNEAERRAHLEEYFLLCKQGRVRLPRSLRRTLSPWPRNSAWI